VIDLQGLAALCGFSEAADFQQAHRQWVEQANRPLSSFIWLAIRRGEQ
jgi:hypothetical protein